MTLMTTETKPAAGGASGTTPPAPPPANTPPSSGGAAPKTEEQKPAGKEPPKQETPPVEVEKAKDDKAGEQPSGAPESYELQTPEGGKELSKDVTTAFTSVARELNLSNKAAQQILDKMSPALAAQAKADVDSMKQGWLKETNEDPTIGGSRLKETLDVAQRALALAPPELRQLLDVTGLGNHKAVIAGFAAIGRRLSPDAKLVTGGEPTPPPKDPIQRLAESYDKQTD